MDPHIKHVTELRQQLLQELDDEHLYAGMDNQPERLESIRDLTSQVLEKDAVVPERQRADQETLKQHKLTEQRKAAKQELAASESALYGAGVLGIVVALIVLGTVFWGSTPGLYFFLAVALFAVAVLLLQVPSITEYPPGKPAQQTRVPTPRPRQFLALLCALSSLFGLLLSQGWVPGWLGWPGLLVCGIATLLGRFIIHTEANPEPSQADTA